LHRIWAVGNPADWLIRIVMAIAAWIDLNTLDNLSRTCRSIRQGLLQYRKMLLVSTLHCSNEDLPVDREDTLRYRARAGNWFYMQDIGRSNYTGKSGECARDLVSECRRCGTVVCRVSTPGNFRRYPSNITIPLLKADLELRDKTASAYRPAG